MNVPPAAGSGSAKQPVAGSTAPAMDPSTPLGSIPQQCKGFEVLGRKTSPGGSVLPNTCAPFDGSFNNPYAIRCIDADPTFKTKYAGDASCILPPPEELGTQIHIAPAGGDSPGKFELAPNAEVSSYYFVNASNTQARYYYRVNWRMRPGAHHMLVSMLDQDQADGWMDRGDMGSEFGGRGKSFGGSQRASVDRPQGTLDIPPENVGLGQQLSAHQQFCFNVHSINTTSAPLLREVWVNIWYVQDASVSKPIQTFAATGSPADMAIPAGQQVTREYKCVIPDATRIISIYGHYHAHGRHFGVWVAKPSGEKIAIYESFNWEDIPVYQYDSVSMNPKPNVAAQMDGASTGVLTLNKGDELHFRCEINNDSTRPLRFADEAITGEMCIMFGSYTGAAPCAAVARVQ
jgi:hypothetical protein